MSLFCYSGTLLERCKKNHQLGYILTLTFFICTRTDSPELPNIVISLAVLQNANDQFDFSCPDITANINRMFRQPL